MMPVSFGLRVKSLPGSQMTLGPQLEPCSSLSERGSFIYRPLMMPLSDESLTISTGTGLSLLGTKLA
jgi:hypothetical protein